MQLHDILFLVNKYVNNNNVLLLFNESRKCIPDYCILQDDNNISVIHRENKKWTNLNNIFSLDNNEISDFTTSSKTFFNFMFAPLDMNMLKKYEYENNEKLEDEEVNPIVLVSKLYKVKQRKKYGREFIHVKGWNIDVSFSNNIVYITILLQRKKYSDITKEYINYKITMIKKELKLIFEKYNKTIIDFNLLG